MEFLKYCHILMLAYSILNSLILLGVTAILNFCSFISCQGNTAAFPQYCQSSFSHPTAPMACFPTWVSHVQPWPVALGTEHLLFFESCNDCWSIPESRFQRDFTKESAGSVLFGTQGMSQHWIIDINPLKSLWKVKTNDATCSVREKMSVFCNRYGYTEGFLLKK